MYCQTCGMHNTDDAQQCQICGTSVTGAEKSEPVKIFTDLTKYPYKAILSSFKHVNLLLAIIAIPIITIIYGLRKLTKRPFWVVVLNGVTPKFHLIRIEQFPRLHHHAALCKISAYLAQQGFAPLIDLEDVSLTQATIQRVFSNPEQTIFAMIHINKASEKMTHVTFLAFPTNNAYLSVDNAFAIPLHYPPPFVVVHLPQASVAETHQEFLRQHAALQSPLKTMLPQDVFPIIYANRKLFIELGLEQGTFTLSGKGTPTVAVCYHHPFTAAVRICAVCQTPLCEACYTSYQEREYCANCLPEAARSVVLQGMSDEKTYAGLGVRGFAMLIDLGLIALGAAGVYFGTFYVVGLLGCSRLAHAIRLLLTQFFVIIGTVFYFLVPVRKYGRTLGKAILGIRIMNHQAQPPEWPAVIVRFAFQLFAALFVLPLFGYLVIPFRKKKQGLHDQLAGTYVVTISPRLKAVISWCILCLVFAVSGWYGFPRISPWFSAFGAFSSSWANMQITLTSVWQYHFPADRSGIQSYMARGETCIVATSTTLQALDMRTGATIWIAENLPNTMMQPLLSQDANAPLLIKQYHADGRATLLHVEPQTGRIVWQLPVKAEDMAAFDSQSIVVYDDTTIAEYDMQTALLWISDSVIPRIQDRLGESYVYVMLNQGILIGRYAETEETQAINYVNRHTGEIVWGMTKDSYDPGYIVGDGYQIMYARAGQSRFMYLPEQRTIWESAQAIGYVMASAPAPASRGDAASFYLYTTTAAVRSADGSLVFSYPAGTRFGCLSNDWLILLADGAVTLLDKFTGQIKQQIEGQAWYVIVYLMEDAAHLYLAANVKPLDPRFREIAAELLIVDKQTFTLREIPVGTNLGALQFHVFPQDQLVFIPTSQHVGAYRIPER